jgi:hypothetical protein
MHHTWIGEQTKKSHKDFVGQINVMTDGRVDVVLTSSIDSHAPWGLLSLCFRD